jgi:choline dehydrogenase-like flavoprotein
MMVQETDFVVVGAGSSGCALAARLSEYSPSQTVLLEAGGPANHPLVRMPLTWMQAMTLPRFGWGTMSEPEPHLDNRVQPLPRGRVLGGCSAINGTMYIRGMAHDYDGWRDAGLAGWSFEDVLPYFRRAESSWRGAGRLHGGTGPLCVTPNCIRRSSLPRASWAIARSMISVSKHRRALAFRTAPSRAVGDTAHTMRIWDRGASTRISLLCRGPSWAAFSSNKAVPAASSTSVAANAMCCARGAK